MPISEVMEHLEDLLNMVINKGFCIKVCGDVDYEGMVIDISYNDQTMAMINYDKGIDKLEIEFTPFLEKVQGQMFLLDDFINALSDAKAIALQCAKEDSEH